ncbi:hypothetical protein ACFL6L_00950 [candidate division KSB1 bacterium]
MVKKRPGQKKQGKKAATEQKQPAFLRKVEENRYAPYILFFLVALIYFAPALFGNNAFESSEGVIYGYGASGGGISSLSNPYAEKFLWNTILGGLPSAEALREYTMYTVVNILKIFVYDFRAFTIYFMLIMFAAGAAMYYFMRTLGMSKIVALVIAVGYQLSPHIFSLTYAGHFSKMAVMALLPLLFALLHRGVETGRIKYFLLLGFCIAVDIYTPHLQLVHFSLLALGFYSLFLLVRYILTHKNTKATVVRLVFFRFTTYADIPGASLRYAFFILAVVIGLGIGARGFVPQYVYNKTESKRSGLQGEGLDKSYATSWNSHAEELASLVVPEFVHYSTPKTGNLYWGKNFIKANADYFGGIVLLLALIGPFFMRRNPSAWFFFALMLYGMFFALGETSPLYNIMYHLVPGIKSFRAPSLMLFVSAFAGFISAGIFINYLFSEAPQKTVKKAGLICLGAAGICAIGAIEPNIFLTPWKSIFYPELNTPPYQPLLDTLNRNIPELSSGFLIAFFLFGLFGGGLLLFHAKKLHYRYGILLLLPLFVLDFWRIDRDFIYYREVTPGVNPKGGQIAAYEYLKNIDSEQPFRVLPWDEVMQSGSYLQTRFRYSPLYFVNGFHDFVMRRYDYMMKQVPNYFQLGQQQAQTAMISFSNLACGKYIVFNRPQQGTVYSDQRNSVYMNPEAMPFFYIRNRLVKSTDETQMVRSILTAQFDYHNNVYFEEEPPPQFSSFLQAENPPVEYSVDVVRADFRGGDVELNVTLDNPGFLVFSENFHSRWTCTVSGEETKIYRANYLFQGVFLDTGSHTVSFRFHDPAIDLSRTIMYISIGLFVCLIILFNENVLRRLKPAQKDDKSD